MTRTVVKWLLLVYVALTFGVIAWQELRVEPTVEIRQWDEGNYLMVTYFHADKRCGTCNNMEAYTKKSLELHLAEQLSSGKVKIRVLNWQDPVNAAYVKRYTLLGNTVIVSEIRDGRELRFKDLVDVWSHVHDKKAYVEYVRVEVQAWTGAL